MHTLSAEALHSLVRDILLAVGADERNADRVAEALVSSNLAGVDARSGGPGEPCTRGQDS